MTLKIGGIYKSKTIYNLYYIVLTADNKYIYIYEFKTNQYSNMEINNQIKVSDSSNFSYYTKSIFPNIIDGYLGELTEENSNQLSIIFKKTLYYKCMYDKN